MARKRLIVLVRTWRIGPFTKLQILAILNEAVKAYQQRVVDELNYLNDRRAALKTFIETSKDFWKLPQQERELMRLQVGAMDVYAFILYKRVESFDAKA